MQAKQSGVLIFEGKSIDGILESIKSELIKLKEKTGEKAVNVHFLGQIVAY